MPKIKLFHLKYLNVLVLLTYYKSIFRYLNDINTVFLGLKFAVNQSYFIICDEFYIFVFWWCD